VEFVIVEGRGPRLMVECKWTDTEVDRSVRYLKARFPKCETWQVSAVGTKDYVTPEGIRVAPAMQLLRGTGVAVSSPTSCPANVGTSWTAGCATSTRSDT